MTSEERFLELFSSNPESFVVRKAVARQRNEKGKLPAEYVTVKRKISPADVRAHFAGKKCIVAKPEMPDGTCRWAKLDHDIYGQPEKLSEITNRQNSLGLPLHPSMSKSGGLHNAVFFSSPVPCEAARELLRGYAEQLGDPEAEIYPKPVAAGKLPFGIALPFFGDPEGFDRFQPILCDVPLNGFRKAAAEGLEELDSKDMPTADTPGIQLPPGVDFEKLLAGKLKFRKRAGADGAASFDYHGIDGQPCLIQGSLHAAQRANARQSRFLVKDGRVSHQCFDSDCQGVTEPKTRKALAALGLEEIAKLPSAKKMLSAGELSDAGNAERLVEAYGNDLHYCLEMKTWLAWDGRRWRVDERQRARALMEKTMRRYVQQVAGEGDKEAIRFAASCLDTWRLTNGLREAEKKLGVNAAELDAHPFLLTFQNGTLDLETNKLLPHQREHLITKMLHFDYKPEAKCLRFLSLLENAVGKEAVPYLQRLCGYSLTGDTSEKSFFIVWRPTNTGKTTFLEILRKLCMDYAVLLQVDTLMERRGGEGAASEDLASLRGARLATTSELDRMRRLSIAMIKRIVQGQGKITTAAKWEKKITFDETHKLWFDTNYLPAIPAEEEATWNRLTIIAFANPLPKESQLKNLSSTLVREEGEGILAWAVEGERLRQKEGLGKEPEKFEEEKKKWAKRMDTLQQFIDERCVVDAKSRERSDALYKNYVAWTGEHPMSHKSFTQQLARRGHSLDKGRRHYSGLRLTEKPRSRQKGALAAKRRRVAATVAAVGEGKEGFFQERKP